MTIILTKILRRKRRLSKKRWKDIAVTLSSKRLMARGMERKLLGENEHSANL
jgi:hypothetical protein